MRSHHQRHPASFQLDDDNQWPDHASDLEVDVHRASLTVLVLDLGTRRRSAQRGVPRAACNRDLRHITQADKLKPQLRCPPPRDQSTPPTPRDRQQFR